MRYNSRWLLLLATLFLNNSLPAIIDLYVGPSHQYVRYDLGNTVKKQQGYLTGFHFDSEYALPCSDFYLATFLDARWTTGPMCSKFKFSEKCPTFDSLLNAYANDYIADLRAGYTWDGDWLCLPFTTRFFTGLGFHHLSYKINPDIMRYKYYQLFIPIGIHINYTSERNFSVGLCGQYRPGIYNRLKVSIPNLTNNDCNNKKIKLKYSHGLRVELPFTMHYLRDNSCFNLDLQLNPFFEWCRFASTNKKTNLNLPQAIPANKSMSIGLNINIGFLF